MEPVAVEADSTPVSALRVPPLTNLSQVSRGSRIRSVTPTNSAKSEGGLQNALMGVEERLSAQIARVQQQGDRLREVALSRMDAKVSTVEALQPKFDRRMAELSGSVKGLSDEMQSQLRRVDQIDTKLWDWRHQIEEELRVRLVEVEQSLQQLGSAHRVAKAAAEDSAKKLSMRMLRLEGLVEEHHAHAEDTNGNLAQLNARLEEIEENHGLHHVQHDDAINAHMEHTRAREADWQVLQSELEQRCLEQSLTTQGLSVKLEAMQQESSDLRARLEIQEEKGRSLRTLQEAKDEQLRSLVDRVERENLEGRLRGLQQRIQELETSGITTAEQMQILQHSLERQEQDVQHLSRLPSPRLPQVEEKEKESSLLQAPVLHLQNRVEKLEAHLQSAVTELKAELHEALESEQSLTPHVSALVTQLKDITPKVISHGQDIQRIQSKVLVLEAQAKEKPMLPVERVPAPVNPTEVEGKREQVEEVALNSPQAETGSLDEVEMGSPQMARAEWQLQKAQKAAQRRVGGEV
ncbi:unnamed protein product [Durusdinium trenchii]|uniref:Uncharacterized protein n=1 Tax=Durusdinium trenchii TaxID=1381693 RepID=A0ABP0HHE9_9DINO